MNRTQTEGTNFFYDWMSTYVSLTAKSAEAHAYLSAPGPMALSAAQYALLPKKVNDLYRGVTSNTESVLLRLGVAKHIDVTHRRSISIKSLVATELSQLIVEDAQKPPHWWPMNRKAKPTEALSDWQIETLCAIAKTLISKAMMPGHSEPQSARWSDDSIAKGTVKALLRKRLIEPGFKSYRLDRETNTYYVSGIEVVYRLTAMGALHTVGT